LWERACSLPLLRLQLFTESDVDPGKQGELGQVVTLALHSPLRFNEGVENVASGFPGFAHAQADGDVVRVAFQVVGPGACGAQVPALGQVVDDKWLKGGAFNMLAVAVTGERALVLHQRTQQAAW